MIPRIPGSRLAARFALSCCIALPYAACDGGRETATLQPVIRDSAGVRLVEHPAAVLELPTLELSASVLQIGDMDGDGPGVFGSIAGVGRLSDGAIAVLDRQAAEVRVFGPDGEFRSRFGRAGKGPGEFENLVTLLVLPGDTISVVDRIGYRAQHFLPDGSLLRQEERERALPVSWSIAGVFADGDWFVLSRRMAESPPADGPEESWRLAGRASRETLAADSLVSYRSAVTFFRNIENGFSFWEIPLAPVGAVAPLGRDIVAHDGSDYSLRWHGTGGSVRQVVRLGAEPPEIGNVEYSAERARRLDRVPEANRADYERTLLEMPRQSRLPGFGPMISDREGTLWVSVVQRPTRPGTPEPEIPWLVVRDDGSIAGRVDLAVVEQPRFLDSTHVVTVWRDELDVERVRVYALPEALLVRP